MSAIPQGDALKPARRTYSTRRLGLIWDFFCGGGSGSAGKKPKQTTIVKEVGRMLSNHPVAGSSPAGRTEIAEKPANDVGHERPKSPDCTLLGAFPGATGRWAA